MAAVAEKRRTAERRAATTRGRRDLAGINMRGMYHKAKCRNQEGKRAYTENTEGTERRGRIRSELATKKLSRRVRASGKTRLRARRCAGRQSVNPLMGALGEERNQDH